MHDGDKTKLEQALLSRRRLRLCGDVASWDDAVLAAEVPVALSVDNTVRAVMLATPSDLLDFALGFCLSEAIIEHAEQLLAVRIHEHLEGIELQLELDSIAAERFAQRLRLLEGRSACGLCGSASLEQAVRVPAAAQSQPRLAPSALRAALAALPGLQPINAACGAVHAAAWCDLTGCIVAVREDVGRHNALDKLIGALYATRFDPGTGFVLLSSRASYEMVMKAAQVGIAIVVAISAPTSLAVVLAEQTNVTLIGFARDDDCAIYSHPQRIMAALPPQPVR